MSKSTVIFRMSRAQGGGRNIIKGGADFYNMTDMISERRVACLLGNLEGNAPQEDCP